jgi:hypothetical protein
MSLPWDMDMSGRRILYCVWEQVQGDLAGEEYPELCEILEPHRQLHRIFLVPP